MKPLNSLFIPILPIYTIMTSCYCDFKHDKNYSCYEQFGYNALVIEPRETIFKKINENFTVFCISNPLHNISSEEMFFAKGLSRNFVYESREIEDEHTISINLSENLPSKFQLTCQDLNNNTCVRDVVIGYPPLNVKNFHCISFSWKVLECAFDLQENTAQRPKDDYILSYSLRDKSVFGFKCKTGQLEQCCHIKGQECWRWDNSADFLYESTQQFLNFTISSTNPLGSSSFTYIVNQYEIMLPDPVKLMKIRIEDDFHILVSGRLPTFLNVFPPGIIYRIKTEVCQREEYIIEKFSGQKKISKTISAPLSGQSYKISISLRSGYNTWISDHDDQWWSESMTQTIVTPSMSPKYAPITTVESFHVLKTGSRLATVTIFWKDLDQCLKGGPGFQYSIEVLTVHGRIDAHPTTVTENFAVFENFTLLDINYIFRITPVNEAGRGEESTEVEIKGTNLLSKGAFLPIVIYHPEENIIQLRWFAKEDQMEYIIYWCLVEPQFEYESLVPCKTFSWKNISNETETNLTLKELEINQEFELQNLRFGVSTQKNYGGLTHSSGIVWSSCLVGKYDPESSKVAPSLNVVSKTSSSVLIIWELDCKTWKGYPLSIDVIWCAGEHNLTSECTVNTAIEAISSTSFELKRLESNRNYTLWIRIDFKYWKSDLSSPLHFTTTEPNLSPAKIAFITIITFVILSIVIPLMVYSTKKGVRFWYDIFRPKKLQIPKGLESEHNWNTKNGKTSSSLSNFNSSNSFSHDERNYWNSKGTDSSTQPLLKSGNDQKNGSDVIRNPDEDVQVQNKTIVQKDKGKKGNWHSYSILQTKDIDNSVNAFPKCKSFSVFPTDVITPSSTEYVPLPISFQQPTHEYKLGISYSDNKETNKNPHQTYTILKYPSLVKSKSYSVLSSGYVQAILPSFCNSSPRLGLLTGTIPKNQNQNLNSLNETINNYKTNLSNSVLPAAINKNILSSEYVEAIFPPSFNFSLSSKVEFPMANINQPFENSNSKHLNFINEPLNKSKVTSSYINLFDISISNFPPDGYVQAMQSTLSNQTSYEDNFKMTMLNQNHTKPSSSSVLKDFLQNTFEIDMSHSLSLTETSFNSVEYIQDTLPTIDNQSSDHGFELTILNESEDENHYSTASYEQEQNKSALQLNKHLHYSDLSELNIFYEKNYSERTNTQNNITYSKENELSQMPTFYQPKEENGSLTNKPEKEILEVKKEMHKPENGYIKLFEIKKHVSYL